MNAVYILWRMIRPLNLFIMASTLVMLHSFAWQRMYFPREVGFGMSWPWFLLFVVASLLVAAAGNIFNDLNDEQIDKINLPEKALTANAARGQTAYRMAWIFNGVALVMAAILAWRCGNVSLLTLFVLAMLVLFGYSSFLKTKPLLGNLAVAALVALLIFSLWIFDLNYTIGKDAYEAIPARRILTVTFFYGGFAFVVSLLREIIKDMADREGDRSYRRTLALIWPEALVKLILLFLSFGIIAGVFLFQRWLTSEGFALVAGWLLITQILFLVVILKILPATERHDYLRLSDLCKWIMLAGIMSGFLFIFN